MKVTARKFIGLIVAVVAFILCLTALLNYYADPIGLFHYETPGDWIHSRPAINDYLSMHKAHDVVRANADFLFLGSSRSHEGLDPHHLRQNAYNLALLGSGPYENLRYLQHATAAHLPQVVILGVDLEFFGSGRGIIPDFSEARLLIKKDGAARPQWMTWMPDLAPSLLSTSALECSVRTLLAPTDPAVTCDEGFGSDPNTAPGRHLLARQVLTFNESVMSAGTPSFRTPDGQAPQLDIFRTLLKFCADHHIKLYVFVHPLHATMVDRFTEDWPGYCDWMTSVAGAIEATNGLDCEFWDFAGYNHITTEPFPLPTDTYSAMKYYNECSHYKAAVGDMVLDRMLNRSGPSGFGRQVTSATVAADLERLKDEKGAWHLHQKLAPIDQ
jgi:hypothetical protein